MDSRYEDHAILWDTQDQLHEYIQFLRCLKVVSNYLIHLASSIQAHELGVVYTSPNHIGYLHLNTICISWADLNRMSHPFMDC